jgi:predicted DNA-binding transcriptional regulator YafY
VREPVICDAIRARQLLIFGYRDAVRIVEPHLYGESAAGHEILSAWMRAGQSRSDPEGGWRTFRVDEIRELQILPEQFEAARPDFNPHEERMGSVFCALPRPDAPPEEGAAGVEVS